MDHTLVVNVDKPPSNVHQLGKHSVIDRYEAKDGVSSNEKHTSPSRSASVFFLKKSLMFPFTIQSDIIAK